MLVAFVSLLILVAAAFLFVCGLLVGRWLSGSSPSSEEPSIVWQRDVAATARTLNRLADQGVIDDEQRIRLQQVLREAHSRHAPTVLSRPTAATPSAALPPVRETASPLKIEPLQTPATVTDEEEVLVAEIIEEPQRARAPAARHPLDVEPSRPTPTPPRQARRALGDVLQAFLEESNVRWGELISGVLIVGCSIALVISLRREIESLSERFVYLPALLFMLATAAIHAAGNYTLRRWNLRATSRGVLIIATLLIPINILAAILVTSSKTQHLSALHPLSLSAIAAGLVAFGTMAYYAGKALMREGGWRLWIAVMGTSLGQVLIHRLTHSPLQPLASLLLLAIPLVAFGLATMWQLRIVAARKRLGVTLTVETLILLGVAMFSLATAVGLLLSKADSVTEALAWLSTPLCLPAVVTLSTGLAIHRRVTSRQMVPYRTAGTSLAVLGAMMMFAAVGFAWPRPLLLVAVGVFGFVALSALAWAGRLPVLHGAALACGTLAFLVGFHWLRDAFTGHEPRLASRMVDLLFTGSSSLALTVLSLIVGGAATVLGGRGQRAAGQFYFISAAGIGGLSVVLAVIVGFFGDTTQQPDLCTPVLLFYAVAMLILGRFAPNRAIPWIGSTLLLLGCVHGLAWNEVVREFLATRGVVLRRPILVGTLLHGLLVAVTTIIQTARDAGRRLLPLPQDARASSALLSSLAATPFALAVSSRQFGNHAGYMAAISLIWLLMAIARRSPRLFAAFQALATIALVFAACAFAQQQAWWTGDLLSPPHLRIQLGLLAAWCLMWAAARRTLRNARPNAASLLRLPEVSVDEVVLGAVLIAFVVMCVVGCWPGVATELGFANPSPSVSVWKATLESGSWVVWLLILAALVASLVERPSSFACSGLFLIVAAAMLLIAGRAYDVQAVASSLRWLFGVYGATLTAAIVCSERVFSKLRRLGRSQRAGSLADWQRDSRSWTLGLSGVPVLGLTTASLLQAAAGKPPGGPSAESWFSRIGPELSYGVPLALLVAMLVAYAVRERNSSFMLAGSAVFQYLVNLAYFLPILRASDAEFGWPLVAGCLQWNALGLAGFGWGWLAIRGFIERKDRDLQAAVDRHLIFQVGAIATVVGLLAGMATALVIARPHDLREFDVFGTWPTYLAWLLGLAAIIWLARPHLARLAPPLVIAFLLILGGPLAISLEGPAGAWRGYHILMIAWCGTVTLATAAAWLIPSLRNTAPRGATTLIPLPTLLALRAVPFDPQTPWWSFGTTLVAMVLTIALGILARRQAYAYASALLAAIAVTIVWWGAWPTGRVEGVIELVQLNLTVLSAMGIVWLLIQLHYQVRRAQPFDRHFRGPVFHGAAAGVATVLFAMLALSAFVLTSLLSVPRRNLDIADVLGAVLTTTLGALLCGWLWDRQLKPTLLALYIWGLSALFVLLDAVDKWYDLDAQASAVAAGLVVAGYVAATGHAWKWGANLAALGRRLRIPNTVSLLRRASHWLPVVTLLLASLAAIAEGVVVLVFRERWMRVSAAFAPLLLAYGVACLAQQRRRSAMQLLALMLASLAAVYAAWADIAPGFRDTFVLERAVRLLMVLAGLALLLALPVSRWTKRRGSDWFPAVRRMAAACGGAALVALGVVLLLELAYFEPGRGVPFGHPYQVFAVAATLVALTVAFLSFALSPQRDPLSLSERGRMAYVYAAQVVGALLFAHLYLSRPDLFGGLKEYWPYIIMGIAFAGVGAGELLQRSGLRVLADPLQRTGSFLPLLPALGWWLSGALGIDAAGHYSLLLFFAGLLYALVAMLRRSYLSSAAAALAGNAALWAVLADHDSLSLPQHPQFWLIPPAVSALVAAQLNRRHLTDAQLSGIRYFALLVIYISSTADIFIGGIGDSLWEPMVLALLSVLGVLAGIGLRVRAFLYLGVTFVFLSVVSMVWHAYANVRHVGIWWAFCIVLGLAILAMLGVFEKKRNEISRLAERLKTWGS